MKKTLSLIALTLILSACSATSSPYVERPANNIYAQTSALKGKPLNDAVILLGRPTGEYSRNGFTTYVWQRRASDSIFGAGITSGRGYQIGHRIHGMSPLMLGGVTYHRCTIKAETLNAQITKIWTEGDPGGCRFIYDNRNPNRFGFVARR